jgi:hypothetical protein
MTAAKTTTNHEVIRRWVEKHGGRPATVKRARSRDDAGVIRIDFPGFSGEESLRRVTWEEWFEKFDEQKLAFLYEEGRNTNFNELVRRDARQAPSGDVRASSNALRRRPTRIDRRRLVPSEPQRESSQPLRAPKTRTTRAAASKARRGGVPPKRVGSPKARRVAAPGSRQNGPSQARQNGSRGSRGRAPRGADLRAWTKAELYARARSARVANRSTMSKSELIRALERART